METILEIYAYLKPRLQDIIDLIAFLVLAGSVVVRLTPTLSDDNAFKPFIKFVGKYLALDKYGPRGARNTGDGNKPPEVVNE